MTSRPREELGRVLSAGIARLPQPHRDALVLRYLHGLTDDEIASALAVDTAAARARVARARGMLRRSVEPLLGRTGPAGA